MEFKKAQSDVRWQANVVIIDNGNDESPIIQMTLLFWKIVPIYITKKDLFPRYYFEPAIAILETNKILCVKNFLSFLDDLLIRWRGHSKLHIENVKGRD